MPAPPALGVGSRAVSARGRPRACCVNRSQMRCAVPITLLVCLSANDLPCACAAMRPQLRTQLSSALLRNAGTACPRGFACTPAAFATSTCCLLSTRALVCKGTKRGCSAARPCGVVCSTRMQLEGGNGGKDERPTHSEQSWGRPSTRDEPHDELLPMPNVPETVFAEFRALWLRAVLRRAVRRENYDTASLLKGKLASVQSQLMHAIEGSVHERVARLRNKVEKSELLRLQHELDQALAEEDYNRAAKTQQQLQREHSKTPAFSGGLKMLDWAWIEADLDARIALHSLRMSCLQADIEARVALLGVKQKHDTAHRLEAKLHELIAMEDYEQAAVAQAKLDEENIRRDRDRMWVQLGWQIRGERRMLQRLEGNPQKRFEYRLQDAIEREDYEHAALLRAERQELQEVHVNSILLSRLQNQLATMAAKMEVDAYAALECKLHVAVGAEEFETADKLRRQLLSLERSRMMTVLEEKLLQYGALSHCFTEADPTTLKDQEHAAQFYYLGNLKQF